MEQFTGTQYLKIDLANQFGLSKLGWQERIWWAEDNEADLRDLASTAKHPILYRKAYRAYKDAKAGKAINHIMGLDATASGIQCMAAMSGCKDSAQTVNLVNTGKREDLYQAITTYMNTLPNVRVTVEVVKYPVNY